MRATVVFGLAMVVASCGGSKQSAGGDGGSIDTGGSSSLNGTWDVTTTNASNGQSALTVVIKGGSVVVTSGSHTVTFAAPSSAVSLAWDARAFTGTHSGTGSSGVLPINLLGDWAVSDPKGGVTASINATSLTATCTGDCNNYVTGNVDGHFTGTKTAASTKSATFGDLAGTWHIADTAGFACDVSMLNSTLQASCSQGGTNPFTITATLSGDMVSGSASTYTTYELSAHRR